MNKKTTVQIAEDLRDVDPFDSPVNVEGWFEPGDGGGGVWEWVAEENGWKSDDGRILTPLDNNIKK